jgi:hypothetical protein
MEIDMSDNHHLFFKMVGTYKTLEEAKFYKKALIDHLGFDSLNDDEVRIVSKCYSNGFYDFRLVLNIDLRQETNATRKETENGKN